MGLGECRACQGRVRWQDGARGRRRWASVGKRGQAWASVGKRGQAVGKVGKMMAVGNTCTPDSTSVETLVASRLLARGVTLRGVAQFVNVPQDRPSTLFTDNDGTWYVSRDATNASSQTYIIRHVRFLQQAEYDEHIRTTQMDGVLNPTDPLTKYKAKPDEQRHMAFCAGYPELALTMWLQSAAFKTWKPKKIVPLSPLTQQDSYASAVSRGAPSDGASQDGDGAEGTRVKWAVKTKKDGKPDKARLVAQGF